MTFDNLITSSSATNELEAGNLETALAHFQRAIELDRNYGGYCQVNSEDVIGGFPAAYFTNAHLRFSLPSSSLPYRDHWSLRLVIFPLRPELPRCRRNVSDARCLAQLIEPAANELQNINTICVIPDEFLWTLPFQALTNTRGNYLIQEFSLFYAPSFTVLNEMALRRQQQNSKESLIAFGNPVIGRSGKLRQTLHPLPDAETEVAAVATALRTHLKKVLVGREADEKTFKVLAPQYATIHLATHGVLDNRDPLNSYLLLTKTEDETENDGLLHAREIIDLNLDADLAVLSACETGNGRISPGEGVIGMSWAFFVAGARSVVVSQWRVNSAGTARLMENFYQAMARHSDLNGRNKSQAIREASLRLLKDRRYRHPFYWAGFVLVSSN